MEKTFERNTILMPITKEKSRLVGVLSWQVPRVWPYVHALVKKALLRGNVVEIIDEDIFEDLLAGNIQLWVEPCGRDGEEVNAIVITEVITTPRMKLCRIISTAGTVMRNREANLKLIEDWARRNGCKRIETRGRFGWSRVGKIYGYEQIAVVLAKDL